MPGHGKAGKCWRVSAPGSDAKARMTNKLGRVRGISMKLDHAICAGSPFCLPNSLVSTKLRCGAKIHMSGDCVATNSKDKLRGPSLADRARDKLRAAILEGELKAGEKINIERVAAKFGISRTPIREALKALETEGLVQIQTNRGAMVEPQAWQEIEHRFRIRSLLEGYAAELACERRDSELIAFLQENCVLAKKECHSQTVTASRARRIAELNRAFHRAIWRGAGSLTLARFLDALDLPQSFSDSFYQDKNARDVVLQQHEAILAAFIIGDAQKARSCMERHIQVSVTLLASAADDHIGDLCC